MRPAAASLLLISLLAAAAALVGGQTQPIEIDTLCTLEQGGAAVVCGFVDGAALNGGVFGVLGALLGFFVVVADAVRRRSRRT